MARRFLLEIVIYGIFAVIYFLVVLRWLEEPLVTLANESLWAYAVIGLLIIVAQGVLLEWLTSQILRFLERRWEHKP